jgi:hypothetical protein
VINAKPLTSRRSLLRLALAAPIAGALPSTLARAANLPPVVTWKDPNCSCCEGWAQHMREAGFTVIVAKSDDMAAIKRLRGVPDELVSCHTALIDTYIVEGHVPSSDILRLIAEKPRARGLAAPGMPPGAPGMGRPGEPYTVVQFGGTDGVRTYAQH